jgi:hypothetical protein
MSDEDRAACTRRNLSGECSIGTGEDKGKEVAHSGDAPERVAVRIRPWLEPFQYLDLGAH